MKLAQQKLTADYALFLSPSLQIPSAMVGDGGKGGRGEKFVDY